MTRRGSSSVRLAGWAAVALVAIAPVAAGCTSLPQSSPATALRELPRDDPVRDDPEIQVDIPPPRSQASEYEIVRDFLHAQEAWRHAHEQARRYLTADAAAGWRDDVRVVVAANTPEISQPDAADRVWLTFRQLGVVNSDGSYSALPARDPVKVTWALQLQRVNGEWRISRLPPDAGVLLDQATFAQVYRPYLLYFLAPVGNRLVPDPRYLPYDSRTLHTPSTLPGRLAQALQDGPSTWLGPAVVNALGAPLALGKVESGADGVLRLDVSGLNGLRTVDQRRQALAQLAWTLTGTQVGVTGVQVTSDGQPVNTPETQANRLVRAADFGGYGPVALPAYYLRAGGVALLGGRALPGRAGSGRLGLDSLAVSGDQRQIAAISLGPSRPTLYAGPGDLRVVNLPDAGLGRVASLTRPTWDPLEGRFWTVPDGCPAVQLRQQACPVVRFTASGVAPPGDGVERAVEVSLRLGDDARFGQVGALQLSRDGTRAAVLAGGRLYVGRVIITVDPDTLQRSILVDGLLPASRTLTDVRDVAWDSAGTLAVLARAGNGALAAWQVPADGSEYGLTQMAELPGPAVSITAASPQLPLVALNDGSIWVYGGGEWLSKVATGGRSPAYPG
ncbi:MAG TPA: LpqB family beta-propeller domain-containing protein [Mycobacteriales bacterium]|nr:LpqB family beta-propeller domain-containing protein [Mycobacteriales bacterium]